MHDKIVEAFFREHTRNLGGVMSYKEQTNPSTRSKYLSAARRFLSKRSSVDTNNRHDTRTTGNQAEKYQRIPSHPLSAARRATWMSEGIGPAAVSDPFDGGAQHSNSFARSPTPYPHHQYPQQQQAQQQRGGSVRVDEEIMDLEQGGGERTTSFRSDSDAEDEKRGADEVERKSEDGSLNDTDFEAEQSPDAPGDEANSPFIDTHMDKLSDLGEDTGSAYRAGSFERFWQRHCEKYSKIANRLFHSGTSLMLVSTAIYMYAWFENSYQSTTGAKIGVIILGFALIFGLLISVFMKDDPSSIMRTVGGRSNRKHE